MFPSVDIVRMAQALARHAGARQAAIATNIAHADTPGYKAQDLADFATVYDSPGGALRATRPQHIGVQIAQPAPVVALAAASPDGNTVSLEGEMVKAVEARQQHDMALAIYRSTSNILRTSLGRGAR